jgi:hypothetical protein
MFGAGLRDVDEAEWGYIRNLSIAAFTKKEIDRLGIETAVRNALHKVDPEGVGTLRTIIWGIGDTSLYLMPLNVLNGTKYFIAESFSLRRPWDNKQFRRYVLQLHNPVGAIKRALFTVVPK